MKTSVWTREPGYRHSNCGATWCHPGGARVTHCDRNPQTFVPNIFLAKPEDYRSATQRIYHAPGKASFVELPVVP